MNATAAPYVWDRGRQIAAAVAIGVLLLTIIGLAGRRQAMTARMRGAAERTRMLNEIVQERDRALVDRDWLRVENALLRDRLAGLENQAASPATPP
jgi:hypothetical protein